MPFNKRVDPQLRLSTPPEVGGRKEPIVPVSPLTPDRPDAPLDAAGNPVDMLVAVSPLTPESESESLAGDGGSVATKSTLPEEVQRVEAQMVEAHKTLQGELTRLKNAMDAEKERQKENIRVRRVGSAREGLESPSVAVVSSGGGDFKTPVDRRDVEAKASKFLDDVKSKQQQQQQEQQQQQSVASGVVFYSATPGSSSVAAVAPSAAVSLMSPSPAFNAASLSSTSPNPSDPAEIKIAKQNLLQIKTKYATVLKKVKEKESKLEKKEEELKKKEVRVQKLADNLRKQRIKITRDKEKGAGRSGISMLKSVEMLAPPPARGNLPIAARNEWGGGGGYDLPMTKGPRVVKKGRVDTGRHVSKAQTEKAAVLKGANPKMAKMKKSYKVKSEAFSPAGDILDESPPSVAPAGSPEMSSVFSQKMQPGSGYSPDSMRRIGELMQKEINKGGPPAQQQEPSAAPYDHLAPSTTQSKVSPPPTDDEDFVENEMAAYRKMFVDSSANSSPPGAGVSTDNNGPPGNSDKESAKSNANANVNANANANVNVNNAVYEAPTSVGSAFGLSPGQDGKSGTEYTQWLGDYEKNFEQLMRQSVAAAEENGGGAATLVPPMDKLREKRDEKKKDGDEVSRRSMSAQGDDRDSSSSRESKSAPTPENQSREESRAVPMPEKSKSKPRRHETKNNKPKMTKAIKQHQRQRQAAPVAKQSAATPLVDTFLAMTSGGGVSAAAAIRTKNTSTRLMRKKKKMRESSSPSRSPPPAKKSETSPVLRQREQEKLRAAEELKRAVAKVISVITRGRMPLFDLLPGTSSSGVSSVSNFTKDLLAQPDVSAEQAGALLDLAAEKCSVTRGGVEMIDVKSFERECRDFGRPPVRKPVPLGNGSSSRANAASSLRSTSVSGANEAKSVANREGGIRTKSKAQEVYGEFTFSFENGSGDRQPENPQLTSAQLQNEWTQLAYGTVDKENATPSAKKGEPAEEEEEAKQAQWWDSYLDGNDSFSGDVRDMQRDEIGEALKIATQGAGPADTGEQREEDLLKASIKGKGGKWMSQFDQRMNAALAKAEGV